MTAEQFEQLYMLVYMASLALLIGVGFIAGGQR